MIMSLGHVNILYCRTRAKTNKVSLGDLGCLIFVLSRPDGGLKRALQSHQRHSNNYTEPKLPPRFDFNAHYLRRNCVWFLGRLIY